MGEVLSRREKMALLIKLRQDIEREVESIGSYSFSNNIIGLCLSQIADKFGDQEANRAIVDYGLLDAGWKLKRLILSNFELDDYWDLLRFKGLGDGQSSGYCDLIS